MKAYGKEVMTVKRMIAPIIITVLVVIYLVVYFGVIVSVVENLLLKILFVVIPVGFALVMVYVCRQRIKEIRSGEENDLSKY